MRCDAQSMSQSQHQMQLTATTDHSPSKIGAVVVHGPARPAYGCDHRICTLTSIRQHFRYMQHNASIGAAQCSSGVMFSASRVQHSLMTRRFSVSVTQHSAYFRQHADLAVVRMAALFAAQCFLAAL